MSDNYRNAPNGHFAIGFSGRTEYLCLTDDGVDVLNRPVGRVLYSTDGGLIGFSCENFCRAVDFGEPLKPADFTVIRASRVFCAGEEILEASEKEIEQAAASLCVVAIKDDMIIDYGDALFAMFSMREEQRIKKILKDRKIRKEMNGKE
jgi:hypothetical protein